MFDKTVGERIAACHVVPVLKLRDPDRAVPLAQALMAGGLPVAEVTFRTEQAAAAMARITREVPAMLVGAGTVTSVEQAKLALDMGAAFLVTAGLSRPVTEFALKQGVPIFPGVCTPTELMALLEYDLPVAKFFPAEQFGGTATLKALSGPFPRMKFMPTGGISPANLQTYLALPCVVACGGSWMAKESLIETGSFDEITRLTAETVALAAHVD